MFSTSGEYLDACSGYHDACAGIPEVHRGCSVHRVDMMMHVGNIMSTSGSKTITQYGRHLHPVQCMFSTSGEYHDAC